MVISYDNNRKQIQRDHLGACERGRRREGEVYSGKVCSVLQMETPLGIPEKTLLHMNRSHKNTQLFEFRL